MYCSLNNTETDLHKWKLKVRQQINDGDSDRRVQFSEEMLQCMNNDGNFLTNLAFADEAAFRVPGHVDHHNCFHYSIEDPMVIRENHVNSPSVCVWAGITRRGGFSVEIVRGTIDDNHYLEICNDHILPYFRKVT